MKYEWKKQDKQLYLPSAKPELLTVPGFTYFTLDGKGDPNQEAFAEAIGVLYSLSYGIKMLPKREPAPDGYYEYSIFPLEGIWDLSQEGKKKAALDKAELLYTIMIRQPDFVAPGLAEKIIGEVKRKKPHSLLDKVVFGHLEEGLSVQMLHLGPYEEEPESFARMEQYCAEQGLRRCSKTHKEIYLTDSRKTQPTKLRTVLRFGVEHIT